MSLSLSPEMINYITTGHCPRCNVVILDADYLRKNSALLNTEAVMFINNPPNLPFWQSTKSTSRYLAAIKLRTPHLAPPGAKVQMNVWGMQCLTCMRGWGIREPIVVRRPRSQTNRSARLVATSDSKPSALVRRIDLNGCRMIQIKEERQVETFLAEERETYRNNSSAKYIQERSISQSVTRAVTTESTHLRASNAEAGITILGFAAIQGQIQQQLSQHYVVAMENILTFNEKTTIEIPPYTTVEHIIHWKIVSTHGIAVLGKPAIATPGLAEVPFAIPLRLTYTGEVNNVPGPKKQSR